MDGTETSSTGPGAPGTSAPTDGFFGSGVLRHAHFRTVYFAAFFSYVGGWFEFVGTQWIVTEKTQSMAWASYLGTAQLAPTLVLGIFGGIVADSVNRRTLLIVTQLAMMLIAIGFAMVVWHYPMDQDLSPRQTRALLWILLGLSLAQGVAIAFNNPAWQVLTPRLVPKDDLYRAITLQGISFNLARAIGPAIAGVVMAKWSPVVLFVVNAISFVGVLAAVLTTPDAPAPPDRRGWWKNLGRIWGDVREAIAFVFGRAGPRAAFVAVVIFATFATPIMRFLSLFVKNVYHLEEDTFGMLTGVMGFGAVLGGLAMKWFPAWYPKHHFIPLSITLGGASILVYSAVSDEVTAGVVMIFLGCFWMWGFNSCMGALQLLTPDAIRGRVLSVVNMVTLGLMPAGYFFATMVGNLAAAWVKRWRPESWHDGLDTQLGVGIGAAICTVCGVWMLIFRTPEIDGLAPGDAGHARVPGLWRGITAKAHRPKVQPPHTPVPGAAP